VRAIGDLALVSGLAWLSWLSPLGWLRLTRAFAGERWWVFGLALGLVVVLAAAAASLAPDAIWALVCCRNASARPPPHLDYAAH